MSTVPPEWFQIVGILTWSTTLTILVYWQPQWIHRLFARIVVGVERLAAKIGIRAPL
jgi:hypothetical protein